MHHEVHQGQYEAQQAPGQWQDPRAQLHGDVQKFMTGVYGTMAAAVAITAGALFAFSSSDAFLQLFFGYDAASGVFYGSGMQYVLIFGPMVYIMLFGGRIPTMSRGGALAGLAAYAVMIGGMISYFPIIYGVGSMGAMLLVTAGMFGAMAAFGYFTKKDLTGAGQFLTMAALGLLIAFFVSFFIPGVYFWVCAIGVFVFAGLTAYDTQRIKQAYMMNGGGGNLAVIGAFMLYASFMNIFIFLMHMFGGRD